MREDEKTTGGKTIFPADMSLEEYYLITKKSLNKYRIKTYFAIVINILLFCIYKILGSTIHHNILGNGIILLLWGGIWGFVYGERFYMKNKSSKIISKLVENIKKQKLFDTEKKLIYWNNYDTLFTDDMIVSIQNNNFIYFKYNEITKIKAKEELFKGPTGSYKGNMRYDYIIFTLKSGNIFTLLIEMTDHVFFNFDENTLNIKKIIPFLRSKNNLIKEEKPEKIVK